MGTSRSDYEQANRYLRDLAERTGAKKFQADSTSNLAYAFGNVAEELRRQYSLGYYPKNRTTDGMARELKVAVDVPQVVIRARKSYQYKPLNR